MKEYMITGVIWILIIALLIGVTFALGIVDLKFMEFFGVRKANVQREIFENNKSHVHGMIDDLAKYKLELTKEKDPTARQAITNVILERFSTFDESKIDNSSLRNFLIDVREGRIQ